MTRQLEIYSSKLSLFNNTKIKNYEINVDTSCNCKHMRY